MSACRDGSTTVIAVVLVLYGIDCIPNAMPNTVYVLAAGALVITCRARVDRTGKIYRFHIEAESIRRHVQYFYPVAVCPI